MGLKSRRKGAHFENEICTDIFMQLGLRVRRKLGQERDSGCDIELPISGAGSWLLECKRRARIGGVREWYEQVKSALRHGDRAAVVVRADGWDSSLVVLELDDFLQLVREELEYTPGSTL